MMNPLRHPGAITTLFSFSALLSVTVHADSAADMAAMQKQMNAQVMEKPFEVEDAAKVDAYINEAMKKDLKPKQTAPTGWQPGYTCDSYYHHYTYNYYGYRDCMYYHHYYGRYW